MHLYKRTVLILSIFLAVALMFVFKDLPKTFFQQDEWWTFGDFIFRMSHGILPGVWKGLIYQGKIHAAPLTDLITGLEFRLFGINFAPYAMVSISLHILNTLLVFWLAILLLASPWLSFFVALLFGVNSIGHQAVSWLSASFNTQGSTLFSIFSVILFLYYVRNQDRPALAYLSLTSAVIVLFFKEIIFAFIVIPTVLIFLSGSVRKKIIKKLLLPAAVVIVLYGFFRFFLYVVSQQVVLGLTEVQNEAGLSVLVYRILTLPFKAFAQSVFSQGFLLSLSRSLIKLSYPSFVASDRIPNPYLVEYGGLDLVCYIISGLGGLITYFVWGSLTQKRKQLGHALILSVAMIIAGALPIIFITGKAGYVSIIEPRHLYIGLIGASFWIVLVFYAIVSTFIKSKSTLFAGLLLLPVFLYHGQTIRHDLLALQKLSDLRRSFLVTIEKAYPKLPQNVVFYTQSDTAYYGLPIDETTLPVQSGFGRMLMVWYYKKEQFPPCLYEGVFLHDLIAEGYRVCEGRGFGYARTYGALLNILKDNSLTASNVIGYSWNSKKQTFTDITTPLRKRLLVDL